VLTRIEIDDFKTFSKFTVDVGPFLVILGANASGKSNLFDAIRLLSRLAATDLRTAVKGLRGEPHELFRRNARGEAATRMAFAVEVLLDPEVRDPWGSTVRINHSRVRYEVEIERRKDPRGIERLIVTREEAKPIFAREDAWPGPRSLSSEFRSAYMRYGRRSPWLVTATENGRRSFEIHQDGSAGRTRSAEAAEATVLSSITSAEFPHLYALREELRSWKFLQLDPVALRRPSLTTAPDALEPDGSNLATVLARIQAETKSDTRPKGALADIAADLAALIPGIVDVSVEEDLKNREYRIDLLMRDEPAFSSRVVSDGTLRVLGLLTLLHDPTYGGLVCFEEPENGVHPIRLKAMIERLRELVSDLNSKDLGDQNNSPRLTQMLLNSHSPVVLSALHEGESMFADIVTEIDPEARDVNRKTRIRPVRSRVQGELDPDRNAKAVTAVEVQQYLSSVSREI
jgi:predicted ATPase